MVDRAQLPQAVNAVGDRIGLNYDLNRKSATRRYVEQYQDIHRIEYDQLKNSYFSLNESKTKKATPSDRKASLAKLKNPFKLNRRTRKALYTLTGDEKQELRYSKFEQVHELWKQYTESVSKETDPLRLFRMDLHGCKLKCVASKNPTHVGHEGIVIQESQNTFLIIKTTNKLVTIPKKESIFEIKLCDKDYLIQGCNLLSSIQARSKAKYKQKRSFSEV